MCTDLDLVFIKMKSASAVIGFQDIINLKMISWILCMLDCLQAQTNSMDCILPPVVGRTRTKLEHNLRIRWTRRQSTNRDSG